MPKISVVVPVYKVEPYLSRCINSILEQTFYDFELILVDDGSPDNCPSICDEYARQDNRIRVIHQENGGLSAARNAGIAVAAGEYIAFIDSDDWVHPNFLDALYYAAQENAVPVSCCKFQRIYKDGNPSTIHEICVNMRATEDVYRSETGCGVDAFSWKFLCHRRLFNGVWFPEGKLWEDVFTTYKLIFQSDRIAEVDAALYYYYMRDKSISHAEWNVRHMDVIEAYKTNVDYFEKTEHIKLFRCVVKGYLTAIHSQYRKMMDSNLKSEEKRQIGQQLKSRMRTGLREYSKRGGIDFSSNAWLYAIAYPNSVSVYWYIIGLLKKLKLK